MYSNDVKTVVIGILAHVDAGKTTLSEAMLYLGGSIRNLGRVDKGDAFLDTYALERERGITIFSKQAEIMLKTSKLTLLDTPGHVDFSAEMERTLSVLDYAILVVSAADGLQGHTRTLWSLLKKYGIPTFLFINKMDQEGADKKKLLQELKVQLNANCIDFTEVGENDFYEEIAMCEEKILEDFLENESIRERDICRLISERKLFPCYFGSALMLDGVEAFMQGIDKYVEGKKYPSDFCAKIYKISRDSKGNRLTHMKITGGDMAVRSTPKKNGEKITQIRIYSGEKYKTVEHIGAGNICAVTGLSDTYSGEGLGGELDSKKPMLEPVLAYRLILPAGCEAVSFFPKIKELEEEEPTLDVRWNNRLNEIQVQVMGEIQLEILERLIKERFEISVEFGAGNILYKETIANIVEGVGHFEPLRHYAEVHLILEPGEKGSGVVATSSCSEDILERNWQMQVLSYLCKKKYKGVLTGSEITDIKITLATGRAHNKHTTGGDFQEAAGRALRQGLMEAETILLEPYYAFSLEVPKKNIGRAIADIERMGGSFESPETKGETTILTGTSPVAMMQNYHREMLAYTQGNGRLSYVVDGYEPCRNVQDITQNINYDPEADMEEPCGSMFCSHGAGFYVPWNRVKEYMHIESQLKEESEQINAVIQSLDYNKKLGITPDEIDEIIERTYSANKRSVFIPHKGINTGNRTKSNQTETAAVTKVYKKQPVKEKYLLVDGYNIIYAWKELAELAKLDIMSARDKLQDIMCNYQAIRKIHLILVFDAYRVKGSEARVFSYHNINVVYTKEAETADQYIEKFAYENQKKYDVTVATSDYLEQIIIRGAGSMLISAREFREEVKSAEKIIQEEYAGKQSFSKNNLWERMAPFKEEE